MPSNTLAEQVEWNTKDVDRLSTILDSFPGLPSTENTNKQVKASIRAVTAAPFNRTDLTTNPALQRALEHSLGYQSVGTYLTLLAQNPNNFFDNITQILTLDSSAADTEVRRLEEFVDTDQNTIP
jgi:hypothetical protein